MAAQDKPRGVLVTGATGRQGGAAARALLAQGTPVRALVRDPHSHKAEALKALGASLVRGDYDDPESLRVACTGVQAVFSVHTPDINNLESDSERVQGRNLVEAAKAARVTHFVHTSVAGAGEPRRKARDWKDSPNKNYWHSKAYLDELVRSAGFDAWTLLKPAFFMENFIRPSMMFAHWVGDRMVTVLRPDMPLALVAVRDIGAACAAAIQDPRKFNTLDIELASDVRTLREVAAVLSDVWGKKIEAPSMTAEEVIAEGILPGIVRAHEEMGLWENPARPEQVRALGLPTTDFETWAHAQWPDGPASA